MHSFQKVNMGIVLDRQFNKVYACDYFTWKIIIIQWEIITVQFIDAYGMFIYNR